MFLFNSLLSRISAYSVVLNITRISISMYNLKGLIETATVLKIKTLQNEAIHLSHNKMGGIFLLCNYIYKKDKGIDLATVCLLHIYSKIFMKRMLVSKLNYFALSKTLQYIFFK